MSSSQPHYSADHSTRKRRTYKSSSGSIAVQNPKILLIHEDMSARDEIAVCLTEAGYHVCQAAGRKEALRLLYAVHPNLVLLEAKPRLDASSSEDGWETLSRIRLYTDTPVIVIAPQVSPADRARCQELPGVEPLEGTVLPSQLLARVAHSLDQPELGQIKPNVSESEQASRKSKASGLTSHFLNTAQLMQVEQAMREIGERGEVRLIKYRGRLRFIAKIKTAQ